MIDPHRIYSCGDLEKICSDLDLNVVKVNNSSYVYVRRKSLGADIRDEIGDADMSDTRVDCFDECFDVVISKRDFIKLISDYETFKTIKTRFGQEIAELECLSKLYA